jgi:hypothetical protein
MVDTPGREKRLPSKGSDRNYHEKGQLSVSDRDAVTEIFCATLLIMKSGETAEKSSSVP